MAVAGPGATSRAAASATLHSPPQLRVEQVPRPARDEMLRDTCNLEATLSFSRQLAASPAGVAGSLWEWTRDTGSGDGGRWARGGGWLEAPPEALRTTSRPSLLESARLLDVGVRCVRDDE